MESTSFIVKMRSEKIESNKLKHEAASKISLTQLPQVPFCLWSLIVHHESHVWGH